LTWQAEGENVKEDQWQAKEREKKEEGNGNREQGSGAERDETERGEVQEEWTSGLWCNIERKEKARRGLSQLLWSPELPG